MALRLPDREKSRRPALAGLVKPLTQLTLGAFRLDRVNQRLPRGATVIALRPKTFAVLDYLVARAGRLVTKEQLLPRRRHANVEAVGYVGRALDLAERLPTTSASARAWACSSSSDSCAAPWATCAPRSRISRRAPATRGSTAATTRRCECCWTGGALGWVDRDRSLAAVEQALALAPRLHDEVLPTHVQGSHALQRILVREWRNEDAEACRLAMDIVRRGGERRHLSLHVGRYAYVQSHRSEYRAACRTAEEALRLAVEVSDAYHYMTAQFHRAWALLHLRRHAQALTSARVLTRR